MRLKEEYNNYRASGLIKKDLQHDPTEPKPKYKAMKNTIKWCKGKVGVPHDYDFKKLHHLEIGKYSKDDSELWL